MKKWLLILALASQAHADESLRNPFELQFAPSVGYSNFLGVSVGLDLALFIGLNEHWQARLGTEHQFAKRYSRHAYSLGANYNFDEDWSKSVFLGFGAGYSEYESTDSYDNYKTQNGYLFADLGKRFRLNQSGSFTWAPHMTVDTVSTGRAHLTISPLNFGWSF